MINIHVDVDNLWMYEEEYGVRLHPDPEYIYTKALPIFLKLLKKTNSKATFMVIGQDLKLPACQVFLKKAVAAGHEIGNHTWTHSITFGALSFKDKKQEIEKTHKQIAYVCGQEPVGFRGPGYYLDKEIISILQDLNYQYDSSILPGFGTLIMSMYAALRGRENRHKDFGNKEYIFSPVNPYIIEELSSKNKILELPISVLPILKLPIHTTFAYSFGAVYRQLILRYLKSKPEYLLYLFHAIDFVDLKIQDNMPIVPLQHTFHQRMNIVQSILEILVETNKGPLKTSRETIQSISIRH